MECGFAEWLVGLGGVIFIVITLLGLFGYSRFLNRLRIAHPLKWQDIRKPEIISIEGSDTDRAASVFLLMAHYRDLNDSELTRIGNRIRMLGFINFAVILLVAVVLVNQLDSRISRLACFF